MGQRCPANPAKPACSKWRHYAHSSDRVDLLSLIFRSHALHNRSLQGDPCGPRCTASCVALTLALALSLRGYRSDEIIEGAEKGALVVLKEELILAAEKKLLSDKESEDIEALYESTAADLQAHLHGDWTTLDLDEGYKDKSKTNKIGYTFKCMGAAFHALKLAEQYQKEGKLGIFRQIIEEIAAEGGDADTNGAAAGALIGAYLGYVGQIPTNWTQEMADQPVMTQALENIHELSKRYSEDGAVSK